MPKIVERIGQEFKTLKTEMVGIDKKDLSNVATLPQNVIDQLKGNGSSGTEVVTISKDIEGNYEDNKSIYIKPDTNIAYYKTTEGWIEVGKLMVSVDGSKKSIACGSAHTVFLLQDGTCKAVGYNLYGMLGDGTTTQRTTPVVVTDITGCTGIACGISHTIFLLQNGTCKAVGMNANGQLGTNVLLETSIIIDTIMAKITTIEELV